MEQVSGDTDKPTKISLGYQEGGVGYKISAAKWCVHWLLDVQTSDLSATRMAYLTHPTQSSFGRWASERWVVHSVLNKPSRVSHKPRLSLNFLAGQIILKKRKTPKLTEVCGVCTDCATNHCQYGAQIQVCFACRGFFRRMARNKIIPHSRNCNRTSSNMAVGQCQIDAKSRKKCAYCRYRKCRDLGMQPELVMSKDEARDYMDKAARVKKTGIAAKFLPDTKYQQRIR